MVYYVDNIGNLIIRVKMNGTCEEIFYKIDIRGDQIVNGENITAIYTAWT